MKKFNFSFVALSILVFVACNKDEDILVDKPDNDTNTPAQTLQYTVVEYLPAPGQYINEAVSGFKDITTMAEANEQAQKRLSEGQFVSLGAWGGSITIKFDNPVRNSGGYDFSVASNTFDSSNEPGIVWVMQDANANGVPDDIWYELKGSHFGKEGYERNYWVTYFKPSSQENTPWEDSNGETGFIYWMGSYHSHDFYYPLWVETDSYTLYGSRLPSQAVENPETHVWVNQPFEWGYVDNYGSDFNKNSNTNQFKISDAVTMDNQPANITAIDFVKVQTAVNGAAGWLGENSTEVCGFFREN